PQGCPIWCVEYPVRHRHAPTLIGGTLRLISPAMPILRRRTWKSMRTFIVAAALAVSAFAFAAPASAAPVAKIDGIHTASPLTLAQYNRHRTRRAVRHNRHYRYTPGHRYRSAPHGWHR